MAQNEICKPMPLFDDMGHPINFGWARQDYLSYDPTLVYAARHRLSESDRYIVHTPTHMVVFEIRDDGWLGYMSISIISLRDKKRSTQTFKTWLPLGAFNMPVSSKKGNIRWRFKKAHLDFIRMEGGARIIKTDIQKFGRHKSLRGELVLSEFDDSQSLVTNQQWRNDKYAFRYTCSSPSFFVEGVIQFGGTEIIFTRGNAWGILDWNRSARPNADIRYWASACGISDGKQLSFCVGYSWADFSHGTENGFFVDGKLHKLNQVTFHIPLSDWLSPWRFTSNDNRLEMTFEPHQERIDRRSLLLHNFTRRQVCGFFSGKVQLDDGSFLEFQNLTGLAERIRMRY